MKPTLVKKGTLAHAAYAQGKPTPKGSDDTNALTASLRQSVAHKLAERENQKEVQQDARTKAKAL